MSTSVAEMVIKEYCAGHDRLLKYLRKLSDEHLHRRPSPTTHAIAWHAWHLARWADFTQACIPGMTPELSQRLPSGAEIWHVEQWAQRWGFDNMQLGVKATGMEMPDEVAYRLTFPIKAELLGYVERTFAAVDHAVTAIDDDQFLASEQLQPMTEGIWGKGTVGDALLSHLTHDNRHLGMMECLLGLQVQSGTATV